MKKSLFVIVSLVLFTIFASGYSSSEFDAKKGHLAPNFEVCNSDTTLSLFDLKGKYVLLSFWSSLDANSRISNIQSNEMAKDFDGKLVALSINYDRNELLFKELVKRDKLQASSQFYDQDGKKSRIFDEYHLDQGYKSYLISPAGEIIAENPGTSQLAKMISQ